VDITRSAIEALAPDQSALTAAAALLAPAKWPLRARAERLIRGECQGSGAHSHRVAGDIEDRGSNARALRANFRANTPSL
jgi:hypothetical protein